jgi:hypothetical protein
MAHGTHDFEDDPRNERLLVWGSVRPSEEKSALKRIPIRRLLVRVRARAREVRARRHRTAPSPTRCRDLRPNACWRDQLHEGRDRIPRHAGACAPNVCRVVPGPPIRKSAQLHAPARNDVRFCSFDPANLTTFGEASQECAILLIRSACSRAFGQSQTRDRNGQNSAPPRGVSPRTFSRHAGRRHPACMSPPVGCREEA